MSCSKTRAASTQFSNSVQLSMISYMKKLLDTIILKIVKQEIRYRNLELAAILNNISSSTLDFSGYYCSIPENWPLTSLNNTCTHKYTQLQYFSHTLSLSFVRISGTCTAVWFCETVIAFRLFIGSYAICFLKNTPAIYRPALHVCFFICFLQNIIYMSVMNSREITFQWQCWWSVSMQQVILTLEAMPSAVQLPYSKPIDTLCTAYNILVSSTFKCKYDVTWPHHLVCILFGV